MILGPDARVLDVGNVGEYGCGCCGGEERKREQDGVFAPDVAGCGAVCSPDALREHRCPDLCGFVGDGGVLWSYLRDELL